MHGVEAIPSRWVDINKGDQFDPDYRSRWVGREFKGGDKDRDDLFAATPPLEAKRSLIAMASCQRGVPRNKMKKLGFKERDEYKTESIQVLETMNRIEPIRDNQPVLKSPHPHRLVS